MVRPPCSVNIRVVYIFEICLDHDGVPHGSAKVSRERQSSQTSDASSPYLPGTGANRVWIHLTGTEYRHSTNYTEYRHSIKHAQHSGRAASLSCVCHSLHWRQIIVPCLLSCQGGSVFVQHYKRVANLACVSHSLHCRHLSNVVGSRVREAARSSRRSSPWLRGKSQPMPFVE